MSASTTPTEWPCWARATARLVVTLDLPTPPLPDEMSSGRVLDPGCGERDRPTLGVTVGLGLAGGGAGRAVQLDPQVLALLVGHHREVELDVGDAVECGDGVGDPILDLVAQGASGDGEGDQDVGGAGVVELGPPEHPEIDDRAVQLRILDRSQRFDELVVRDCHAVHCGGALQGLHYQGSRIRPWPPPASPPPCRLSPMLSATRRGAASTCSSATGATTGSPPRRSPTRSACIPTSPVTTSTSSPPAAISRSRPAKLEGGGAGRPSKRYLAVADAVTEFPVRSDDLVLSLLGRALNPSPADEAERMAEEVGAEYGRAMAAGLTGDAVEVGHRSMRSAIQAVADALTAHGFAAHAESRNDRLRIINDHCPFGDVALEHPVICAVDRGMVRGMLSELYDGEAGGGSPPSRAAAGDTFCTTAV